MKILIFFTLLISFSISEFKLRNSDDMWIGRPKAPWFHGSKKLHDICDFQDVGTQCQEGMRCGPRNEYDEERFPEIKSLTYRCYMWDGDCVDDSDCDFISFCNAKDNFCDRPPIPGWSFEFYRRIRPELFLTPEEARARREKSNRIKYLE